jgi:hypothetical protein
MLYYHYRSSVKRKIEVASLIFIFYLLIFFCTTMGVMITTISYAIKCLALLTTQIYESTQKEKRKKLATGNNRIIEGGNTFSESCKRLRTRLLPPSLCAPGGRGPPGGCRQGRGGGFTNLYNAVLKKRTSCGGVTGCRRPSSRSKNGASCLPRSTPPLPSPLSRPCFGGRMLWLARYRCSCL